MTTMYSALVFPQTQAGQSYARPPLPATFVGVAPALVSPIWNPYSANAADRTEYWADSAGTLAYSDALLGCYGIVGLQQQQIGIIKAACDAALAVIPAVLNGNQINLANTQQDQINSLMVIQTAQTALATAPAWTKAATVTAGSLCNQGGVILFCSTGGTTGSTAPTPPTGFGTPVTDGTAAWELMGQLIGIDPTGAIWVTPQNALLLAAQGVNYVTATREKYQALKNGINAAQTVASIQSINW